jgi:purine-nucleoside phosphorylase
MYEGHEPAHCVVGVRALLRWGVQTLIVTASSGSLRPDVGAGSVVLITDHINLTGRNPLVGPNLEAMGPRFPDCTYLYDRALRARSKALAEQMGMTLHEGVYVAVLGPSYETPAEVRMLGLLGADLVGMSLIPEALAGRHGGARVLAFSVVANLAAGLTDQELRHEEMTDGLDASTRQLAQLIVRLLEQPL